MDTTFRDYLKAHLKRLGLKQTVFADLMGVAQGTVSRWSNGGDLNVSHLHRMAEVLGVTVEEIAAVAAEEASRMEITHAQLATWLDGPIPGRRTAFQQRGRDQMVAVLWWRFFDSEPRSRAWIAAQLSRSPTRVYQIEAKGLRMLRHRSRRATFDDYRDLAGTPFYDAVFDW